MKIIREDDASLRDADVDGDLLEVGNDEGGAKDDQVLVGVLVCGVEAAGKGDGVEFLGARMLKKPLGKNKVSDQRVIKREREREQGRGRSKHTLLS